MTPNNNSIFKRAHDRTFKPHEGEASGYYEIIKLRDMLVAANIPFKWDCVYFGYQILIKIVFYKKILSNKGKNQGKTILWKTTRYLSAIENDVSIGHLDDKIEIQNAITQKERSHFKKNNVYYGSVGNLTADEVFKRFKYCYDNKTIDYVMTNK